MKLTSMKLTKKERKDDSPDVAEGSSREYAYGLKVDLNKESLRKLGLTVKNFKKGQAGEIHGKFDVSGGSWNDDEYGSNESVTLQITDMALKGVSKSKFQQFSEESKKGPEE